MRDEFDSKPLGQEEDDDEEGDGLIILKVIHDENGEELPMKVGKTFIQIVDNEQPVVVVADEAIDGAVEPQAQRDRVGTGSKK